MRRRALIAAVGGVAALAAGTLGLGAYLSPKPEFQPNPLLPLPLHKMSWQLTDDRGQVTRPGDWVGRPAMVFFGFTFCPDVCPTTLSDIGLWLEELGSDADRLAVNLISVDPERDTPQVLAEYLSNFDPRIRGLTLPGTPMSDVLVNFRAQAERREVGSSYTMNHTAGVFLFRPDGRYFRVIDFHEDRAFAVPKIRRSMG